MRSALVVAALAVAAFAAPSAAAPTQVFAGTGAWVSIYDSRAWRAPERTVDDLSRHDVRTLYLETSNYRQRVDVVQPAILARFLTAAHAAGINVVGWYLPSLAQPTRDLRRALAGAQFATAHDELDGFALDVESTHVRSIPRRNSRALALTERLRRALGDDVPLGVITIAPVRASPSYWPGYPFAKLARRVDVLLPMTYFTARVRGPAAVAAYVAENVRTIRGQIGDPTYPVHPIGGSTPSATAAEVASFVGAATACDTVGTSLWEYARTTPAEWSALTQERSVARTVC